MTDEGEEHARMIKKSKKVMPQIILALSSEYLMNKIRREQCRDKNLPTGNWKGPCYYDRL